MLAGFVSVEDVEKKKESLEAERSSVQPKIEAEEARLSKLLDDAKEALAEASVRPGAHRALDRAERLLQGLMDEPLLHSSTASESLHIKRLKIALFSTFGLLKEDKGEYGEALELYSRTLCVVSGCEDSEIISGEELIQLYRCIAMVARLCGRAAVCKLAAEAGLKLCPNDWRFQAELLHAQRSMQDVESAQKQEQLLRARLPRAVGKRLFAQVDPGDGSCWWNRILKWRKTEEDAAVESGGEQAGSSRESSAAVFQDLQQSKDRMAVFSALVTALDSGELAGSSVFVVDQRQPEEAQGDGGARSSQSQPAPREAPQQRSAEPQPEPSRADPSAPAEEEPSHKADSKQANEEATAAAAAAAPAPPPGGQGCSSSSASERRSTRKSARLAMVDQLNIELPQAKPSVAFDISQCLKWLNASTAMIADVLQALEKFEAGNAALDKEGGGGGGLGEPAPQRPGTSAAHPARSTPINWESFRGQSVYAVLCTLLREIGEAGWQQGALAGSTKAEAKRLATFTACLKSFRERYRLPVTALPQSGSEMPLQADLLESSGMDRLAREPLAVLAALSNKCSAAERKGMLVETLAISRDLARQGESVTAKAIALSAASMLQSLPESKENGAWGFEELRRCWEDANNPDYHVDTLQSDGGDSSARYAKMPLVGLWNDFKADSKDKKRVLDCTNALLSKLRGRQQSLLEKSGSDEIGKASQDRKVIYSTMELEALLALLSHEVSELEVLYRSIDSAMTDAASKEVDLWKTLDKHCGATAKVLHKICNCLDEVLPHLPFSPEDTAAAADGKQAEATLSAAVFSAVLARALLEMANALKRAFSIPGTMVVQPTEMCMQAYIHPSAYIYIDDSVDIEPLLSTKLGNPAPEDPVLPECVAQKDNIRRLDFRSKRLDKFREMEHECATGVLLAYHALQVQTNSTDPATSLTMVRNLHSLLAEVGLCRARNARFLLVSLQVLHCARRSCSTFYETDKSGLKDGDSDEDKLDAIASKYREMQEKITQARRQVFYCLYDYNICSDDKVDNHDNFSTQQATKPALREGEMDQEAVRIRREAMADIYKYDLQPLAEKSEDLRKKSRTDVRQALAEIASHFPISLDEIRPVMESVLEYLNSGGIQDKQVSHPLYSPWVKTPMERMADSEQEDPGKWKALLIDRTDAESEDFESDQLLRGIYSSQAKINSSLLDLEEFFLTESARGDVANSIFNFGVNDIGKLGEWRASTAPAADSNAANTAKQSQGRRRLFSSFLEDCSASIEDGRRSISIFEVRPDSAQVESFDKWSKAIYLCDCSYELENTLVTAVVMNPSSWKEWRQMAGLYTLLMDVLLSDSAKMFSRVEVLEKPLFVEVLERVRRRCNRSFLMCHRLLCKELQRVQSNSSGADELQRELSQEILDVESQYAVNIFERLQNIPPLYDCNNLGPKRDTETFAENIRASLNVYDRILSRVMAAFPKQFLAAELDPNDAPAKDYVPLNTNMIEWHDTAWESPFYVGKLLGKFNSLTDDFPTIVSNRIRILQHFACSTEIGNGSGKGLLEPFYRLHASRLKISLQTLSDIDDDLIEESSSAKIGELLQELLETLMKFTFDVSRFKDKLLEELEIGALPQDECILRCVSWDAIEALDYAFRFKDSHNVQMYRAQYRKAMGLLELNESEAGVDMALDCLKSLFFNPYGKKEANADGWTSLKMDKIRMWELNDLAIKKDDQKKVQRNSSVDRVRLPPVDELDSSGAAPLQEANFLPGNWQKDNVVMYSQGRREVSYKYVSAVLRASYSFAALLAAKGRIHALAQLCEGLYFVMKKDTMSWACLFDAYTRARGLYFLCLNWCIRKTRLRQRGALLYHACRTFVQHHTRWNDLVSEAMDAAMNLPRRIEKGVGGARWVWEKIFQMQSIVSLAREDAEDQNRTLLEFKEYAMDYIFDLENAGDFIKIEKEFAFLKSSCKSAKFTSDHTREYRANVHNSLVRVLTAQLTSLTRQLQEANGTPAVGELGGEPKDERASDQDNYKNLSLCVQSAKALYKGDGLAIQSEFDTESVTRALLQVAQLVSYGKAEELISGQEQKEKLCDELVKRLKRCAEDKPDAHDPEPAQVPKDAVEEKVSVIEILDE